MRIFFDNVNFQSRSGPNAFANKLANSFISRGHTVQSGDLGVDHQLAFITHTVIRAPITQRLDGIYFNTAADWKEQNAPIKKTYDLAKSVVFQTDFNKKLTQTFFGQRDNCHVVRNGTNLKDIACIPEAVIPETNKYSRVWLAASEWRPHKRLRDNVEYFLSKAGSDECLLIAGKNPNITVNNSRVMYLGDLQWSTLISVMKLADVFIHLSFLDHCPNCVVDARAAGCSIICSSSGGTAEIAGSNATVVKDLDWNFSPLDLYNPPKLDYDASYKNTFADSELEISRVADEYLKILQEA